MNHKLILDGGMGQALLKRGMKPNGSLWSASALIDENQHNIVEETHLDFINAGCGAIITNNFTVRDRRLEDNNILEKKKYLLDIAGKIAFNAVKKSGKKVLVGGSLPTQGETYMSEIYQTEEEMKNLFHETANTLNPYSDFFYLEKILPDLQSLDIPYGFKVNAFKNIPDDWNKATNSNPNEALGLRLEFTPEIFKYFVEKELKNGASIVGGCCETHPEHIEALSH
jgi:S-methylmethionine-dependent homocysteine/selenocysteine methylase